MQTPYWRSLITLIARHGRNKKKRHYTLHDFRPKNLLKGNHLSRRFRDTRYESLIFKYLLSCSPTIFPIFLAITWVLRSYWHRIRASFPRLQIPSPDARSLPTYSPQASGPSNYFRASQCFISRPSWSRSRVEHRQSSRGHRYQVNCNPSASGPCGQSHAHVLWD